MTNATQSPARGVVTQEDGEAASDLLSWLTERLALEGPGKLQVLNEIRQRFARHRLAHQSSGEVERLRTLVSQALRTCEREYPNGQWVIDARAAIAIKGGGEQ